jgi:hypothetical protein
LKRVLCIDIGGTRIKWAILHSDPSLVALQQTSIFRMSSVGWENQTLPDLLSPAHGAGILHRSGSIPPFGAVSCAVCTEVNQAGEIVGGLLDRGVPADLRWQFERLVCRPVRLQNDSEAWLRGSLRYAELMGERLAFPCLALIFGTGVAFAHAREPESIQAMEFRGSFCGNQIARFIGQDRLSYPGEVHRILGTPFFDWAARHVECVSWSYDIVRQEFTDRVSALARDIQEEYVPGVKTLFIGGGHADYVSASRLATELHLNVHLWKERPCGMDPDLIPLLGCALSSP